MADRRRFLRQAFALTSVLTLGAATAGSASATHQRATFAIGQPRRIRTLPFYQDAGYPAPRYPDLPTVTGPEQIADKIERMLTFPPFLDPREGANMNARYAVEQGDAILVDLDTTFHPWVADAFQIAGQRAGVQIDISRRSVAPPNFFQTGPTGAADLYRRGDEAANMRRVPRPAVRPPSRVTETTRTPRNATGDLAVAGGYALFISGAAGPIGDDRQGRYRNEHIQWHTPENWASNECIFPPEVQDILDRKVFEQVQSVRGLVRVTDPEGTDITFTNYDDGRWNYPSHQWLAPANIGRSGKDSFEATHRPDMTGVVVGTTNHLGSFPRLTARMEGGQVVAVEGEGVFADSWRQKLEETRQDSWPDYIDRFGGGAPGTSAWGPGYFWAWEMALGTHVLAYRPTEQYFTSGGFIDNYYERRRAGAIHMGLGPSNELAPLLGPGMYTGHVHIHLLFPTWEGHDANGNVVRIIDRGHLTALDDPEVRAVAARFGEPDQILAERYFQGLPGINLPGDYLNDYALDPITFQRQELENNSYSRVPVTL
jgi:hypothetical protein